MEAVFFILVGGALFSQSWNLLGLLAEGRSLGLLIGSLALMSLIALIIDPMVIESELHNSHWVTNNAVFKALIILTLIMVSGLGYIPLGCKTQYLFSDKYWYNKQLVIFFIIYCV